MPTSRPPAIWFPAKRYGWGWGPPVTWQGWAVTLGWIAFLFAGLLLLTPEHPLGIVIFMVVMCAFFIGICYAKGERPRWRWGDDRE
jgi:hypothetical protein